MKYLLSLLVFAFSSFSLYNQALAGCSSANDVLLSVGSAGPGAALSVGPDALPGTKWHLQGFNLSCGKQSGSAPEIAITVTGLSGGTVTYYVDEDTAKSTIYSEDYGFTAAAGMNTAIKVNIPAASGAGPCSIAVRYCQ